MPPKTQTSREMLLLAEEIKSFPDGAHLSSLLLRLCTGEKNLHKLFSRWEDGVHFLGKSGDKSIKIPLNDVSAVHHFMTVTLGIAPQEEEVVAAETFDAPQIKIASSKCVTAKSYLKNPPNFEALIKTLISNLGLTEESARAVHGALLPSIFMVNDIRICLDEKGDVVGIEGMDSNGICKKGLKIVKQIDSSAEDAKY